ncbi:MAG: SulP family inorganic anion transporter [Bryobacterales bacterium]|nr:SulP family inorganic anion transporter [Bryobacterales bacterium]
MQAGEPMTAPATLPKDFLASIVVFLVALPLCMGIAIASGTPPALGLLTGIVGGVVAGLLAGSPLQVSGPAAGLAVLVYQLVQEHGLAMLGVVLAGAGALQLVAGLFKIGQWFRAISPSVIHGMLAGIGVLIFASQFHVAVDDSPRGNGLQNLLSIPEALYKGVFPLDGSTHHLAAAIGLATVLTILGWNRFRPHSLRMVPSALVAVIVASVAAAALRFPIKRIETPENLVEAMNFPALTDFSKLLEGEFLLLAFVFAFVASAETLLCATAVDQMHTGPRTNYDRELAAQGVGNLICGALGALPMTGVIVRSSANVQAGAKTRASAVIHGMWLLATVAIFPWLLNHIPTASLAAILVYTGFKLVNIGRIRRIAGFGRAELGIYFATLAGIVATDLLTGVLVGLGLALAKLIYTFAHVKIERTDDEQEGRVDLALHGSATFLGIPRIAAALEGLPAGRKVHVHVEHLSYIDHACLDLLSSWEEQYEASGGQLIVEWQELVDRYHAAGADRSTRSRPDGERSRATRETLSAISRQ